MVVTSSPTTPLHSLVKEKKFNSCVSQSSARLASLSLKDVIPYLPLLAEVGGVRGPGYGGREGRGLGRQTHALR